MCPPLHQLLSHDDCRQRNCRHLSVATDNFTLIAGQPTDDDINTMEKALLPLLHNINYDMYGPQNLVGIIEPTITYMVTWGQAFVQPPRPTTYNLTIQDNATTVV